MSGKPIPITTDPSDPDSPAGAIPVEIFGAGGGGGEVAWGDVTGKPSTFAPATHTHPIAQVVGLQEALDTPVTWGVVTGKPATFPPTIGSTATTAAAGNHVHTVAQVTGLQAQLDDLNTRLEALETP